MKDKSRIHEMAEAFFICTTCICILQGILGMMLYPTEKLTYDAFLVPPLFGVFSVLFGIVTWSKEEQTIKQVLIRRAMHLILIEVMVFGVNYLAGNRFPLTESVILAIGIAVVFVTVYVITWLFDRKSAREFNDKLKEYQENRNLVY